MQGAQPVPHPPTTPTPSRVADVWEAAAAAEAAAAGGPNPGAHFAAGVLQHGLQQGQGQEQDEGALTLLHLAAASGSLATVLSAARLAAAAAGDPALRWWRVANAQGRTPLHILAACAPREAALWTEAQGSGSDAAAAWSGAGDVLGITPQALSAAAAAAAVGGAGDVTAVAVAGELVAGGAAAHAAHADAGADAHAGADGAAKAPGKLAAEQQGQGQGTGPRRGPGLGVGPAGEALLSCIRGFRPAATEASYGLFLGRRTLLPAAAWACTHMMLLTAAVVKLLRDGRPQVPRGGRAGGRAGFGVVRGVRGVCVQTGTRRRGQGPRWQAGRQAVYVPGCARDGGASAGTPLAPPGPVPLPCRPLQCALHALCIALLSDNMPHMLRAPTPDLCCCLPPRLGARLGTRRTSAQLPSTAARTQPCWCCCCWPPGAARGGWLFARSLGQRARRSPARAHGMHARVPCRTTFTMRWSVQGPLARQAGSLPVVPFSCTSGPLPWAWRASQTSARARVRRRRPRRPEAHPWPHVAYNLCTHAPRLHHVPPCMRAQPAHANWHRPPRRTASNGTARHGTASLPRPPAPAGCTCATAAPCGAAVLCCAPPPSWSSWRDC